MSSTGEKAKANAAGRAAPTFEGVREQLEAAKRGLEVLAERMPRLFREKAHERIAKLEEVIQDLSTNSE